MESFSSCNFYDLMFASDALTWATSTLDFLVVFCPSLGAQNCLIPDLDKIKRIHRGLPRVCVYILICLSTHTYFCSKTCFYFCFLQVLFSESSSSARLICEGHLLMWNSKSIVIMSSIHTLKMKCVCALWPSSALEHWVERQTPAAGCVCQLLAGVLSPVTAQ